MNELKPCPFCGSGVLYETRRNGYLDETPTMFCNSCKAVVTWEQVEEEGVDDETKAFVREHWNTRADDYRQAAEYWQRMYEEKFAERTCHIVTDGHGWWECDECDCSIDWDSCDPNDPPSCNYCPNCGRKVVD